MVRLWGPAPRPLEMHQTPDAEKMMRAPRTLFAAPLSLVSIASEGEWFSFNNKSLTKVLYGSDPWNYGRGLGVIYTWERGSYAAVAWPQPAHPQTMDQWFRVGTRFAGSSFGVPCSKLTRCPGDSAIAGHGGRRNRETPSERHISRTDPARRLDESGRRPDHTPPRSRYGEVSHRGPGGPEPADRGLCRLAGGLISR